MQNETIDIIGKLTNVSTDLIASVAALLKKVETLEADVNALKKEVARLKGDTK